MNSIKIIIIGDEVTIIKKLRQKLHSFYSKNIHIVAIVSSMTEAYPLVVRHQPDLVFLDLDVPKKNEFGLFKHLSKLKFKTVIMTVADKLNRFKFDIVKRMKSSIIDYFLKPLDEEDLNKLEHILSFFSFNNTENKIALIDGRRHIIIANSEGKHIISLRKLIRLKGNEGYSSIFVEHKGKITKATNIGTYKKILIPYRFYSTHRSHIINIEHLVSYTKKYVLMSDGAKVPIARGRWQGLDDYFNGNRHRGEDE